MILSPSKYCESRVAHHNAHCEVIGGLIMVTYNNTTLSFEEFNKRYPPPSTVTKIRKAKNYENPDKTKDYLYG